MSVNVNKAPERFDKLFFVVAIFIFLSLAGGTINEYRKYREGVGYITRTKEQIAELQGRKERLEKLVEETGRPEFIETGIYKQLGLTKEGETVLVRPTIEPKLIDLRMPDPPPRKVYWREWLKLLE